MKLKQNIDYSDADKRGNRKDECHSAYKDLASSGIVGAPCQMNVASLFHIFELPGYL